MPNKTLINTQEKEFNNGWHFKDQEEHNEGIPPSHNGNIDLYNFDLSDVNDCCMSLFDTNEIIGDYKKLQHRKLRIVKLNEISISPMPNNTPHILNLKQEFTFPQSNFTAQKDIFTQTNVNRIKTPYPHDALRALIEDQHNSRPQSFPMDSPSNHSMKYARFTYDEPKNSIKDKNSNERIGDGINNYLEEIKCNLFDFEKRNGNDLEIAATLPCPNPVQRVILKPKNQSTPTFKCKNKCQRPSSKLMRKKEMSRDDFDESATISDTKNKETPKKSNPSKESKIDVTSNDSTDFCNVGGSLNMKLTTIVEQLQDFEWEVCIDGLKKFRQIAPSIKWESDLGAKFTPIISRKLIDFFKSPRSNLCRTACQVAGDFFLLAKSTKRPEFDEMVDILLCKTADPNRFIQKDANTALDKMVSCISVHHSVRAICAKGTTHKNPVVRAAAARVLTEICIKVGNDHIVGSDANTRTRKRILTNLAKFLLDKNIETRTNGEQMCKLLKSHKFFMEYFFKDVENNLKNPLRKILNHIN